MTPIRRRTWALSALALILILGACSTPDDLAAPTLEPQFGTAQNDFGVDVAAASSGRVYVLSEQVGEAPPGEYSYQDTNTKTLLNRYDASGKLIWTKELIDNFCTYECYLETPRSVSVDAKGFIYVLIANHFTGESDAYPPFTGYYLYKYDDSGRELRQYTIGNTNTNDPSVNQISVDVTVDSAGNIYAAVAERATSWWGGNDLNFVAKYSATGALQWQRGSTVGTPNSISLSSSGFVYVAGSSGVAKYSGSGDLRWTKTGAAEDIAVSGTSSIYARYRTTVRKLNADGKQLWSKTQTGLSGMVVADMTTDAKANVYLTGKYSSSSRGRDVFTRKLSSSGSTLFTKTFGTTAYDDANGIATLNGSEIYLTGATQGALVPPYRGGENDGYVRKLNSSGNPVWTR